jgi:hypothetical protein
MNRTLLCLAVVLVAGCAAKKPDPSVPGAETVRVATHNPGQSFVELGPVQGFHGEGCGDKGQRGSRDGAIASLMKNAFAMGGTYVQVMALHEPRQMGECFVNIYRISGNAYREAKIAAAPTRGAAPDVVQQLRELQALREQGAITPAEFEKLKARIITP